MAGEQQGRHEICTALQGFSPFGPRQAGTTCNRCLGARLLLDYQNRRGDHVQAVLDNLIDWDYVASRLTT
jgi:hypothetical protein